MLQYIVTNKPRINVRAQMDWRNAANIKRKMSNGEGFTVYQTYVINGNELWGRVSDNPGDVQQEYVCISIGNRSFCKADEAQPEMGAPSALFFIQLDAWAREKGYKGVPPF